MGVVIKLSDIIAELDMMSSDARTYLHLKTGEFVVISDYIDVEEEATDIEENPENYILLPTQYEINEYRIIEAFVDNIDNDKTKAELHNAIRGRHAFRRFKDTIRCLNIESQWYNFKNNALRELAIEWCEENKISCE